MGRYKRDRWIGDYCQPDEQNKTKVCVVGDRVDKVIFLQIFDKESVIAGKDNRRAKGQVS